VGSKPRTVPFEKWEGACEDDTYIRITSHMMKHPAYVGLSASSKELYLYLKDWAGFKNDEVKYSSELASLFMTRNTYYRARDELISKGFIYWLNKPTSQDGKRKRTTGTKYKREASLFRFVDTWWSGIQYAVPQEKDNL